MNNSLSHNKFYKHRISSFLLFGLAASSIFLFVVLRNLAPIGAKSTLTLNDSSISALGPSDRVKLEDNGTYKQLDNLIYFTTIIPFHFEYAKVKISFQIDTPEQELHIGFRDEAEWHYNTKIIHSPVFNNLIWTYAGDTILLYQKTHRFNSIETFLKDPPKDAIIGSYKINNSILVPYVTLSDYKPSQSKTIIDSPIRGSHTMYVFLDHEPFQMTFYKQDLNWYEGEDKVNVKIFKNDDLVYEIEGEDDGITDASKNVLPEQKIEVKNPGSELPESGVYKVVINAPGDVIIKRIETNLSKIVFADSVFLAGSKEAYGDIIEQTKPQIVYTDAALISAQTYHGAGIQNITVDDKILRLQQVKTNVATASAQPISEITVPKNDVILNGILGYFAFSRDAFFIPTKFPIREIKNEGDISLVDYILTEYKKPKREGDWYIAEATFDLSTAVPEKNKLSWIIRAPGLKENNREIIIKDIEIEMIKKPWPIFDK